MMIRKFSVANKNFVLRDTHVAIAVVPLDPEVSVPLLLLLSEVVGEQAQLLNCISDAKTDKYLRNSGGTA